jgi:hypothetical protein
VIRLLRRNKNLVWFALVVLACAAPVAFARDLLVSWQYEEPMLAAAPRQNRDLTQVPQPTMPEELSPAPAPLPPEPSNSRVRSRIMNEAPPAPVQQTPQLQQPGFVPQAQPPAQQAPQVQQPATGSSCPSCESTSNNYSYDAPSSSSGCENGACANGSCVNGNCCTGSCANGSCPSGSCVNGSCANGSCTAADCESAYAPYCSDCSGCDCSSCGKCGCSQWYFNGDVIFLWRDNRSNVRSIINSIAPATSVFNTRDVDFDTGIGPSFRIGHMNDECSGWEVQYYSALDFSGEADVIAPVNLAGAGQFPNLAGWNGVDEMHADYTSELHNVEINYQRVYGRLSLLAGFRYVRLTDDLGIRAITFGSGSDDYRVHSENNLFGAQLGGRYRACYNTFFWEFTGKAGVFGNDANQSQFLTADGSSTVLRNFTGAAGSAAFVGDMNISAGFQLTDIWAFRCGYNMIWIDQVALAADNLDFNLSPTAGSGIDKRGDVFLHGINIGLEGRW